MFISKRKLITVPLFLLLKSLKSNILKNKIKLFCMVLSELLTADDTSQVIDVEKSLRLNFG